MTRQNKYEKRKNKDWPHLYRHRSKTQQLCKLDKRDNDIQEIKLCAEDNNLEKVLEADAIVMSGGIDTHPKIMAAALPIIPMHRKNLMKQEMNLK